MYYRSDWPEVGLPTALTERRPVDDDQGWRQEIKVVGGMLRWVAIQSEFESNLYGFPMWNLRLEIEDADGDLLTTQPDSALLQKHVNERVCQLLDMPPWRTAYVYSKLVKGEPLYDALLQVGFQETEIRRVYMIKVRDIVSYLPPFSNDDIRLTSLAKVEPDQLPSFREQILDICQVAFEQGHSRHFTDPVLLERLPGIAYILAAMELNFERVAPDHLLIAVDSGMNQICGFSVIAERSGLHKNLYTQLLSAVRKTHQRRGIHRGMTRLITQLLPQDATLLNVTHVSNLKIRGVYQSKSRDKLAVHVADVSVLRRVFHADGAFR